MSGNLICEPSQSELSDLQNVLPHSLGSSSSTAQFAEHSAYKDCKWGKCSELAHEITDINIPKDAKIFSEYDLMIQSLRMLQGFRKSMVFSFANQRFSVQNSVILCTAEMDVTQQLLETFAKYGAVLVKIYKFLDTTQQIFPNVWQNGIPSVHFLLIQYLHDFVKETRNFLEHLIISTVSGEAGQSYGILQLNESLQPLFLDLDFLSDLFNNTLDNSPIETCNQKFFELVLLDYLLEKVDLFSRINCRSLSSIVCKVVSLVIEQRGEFRLLTDDTYKDQSEWHCWFKNLIQQSSVSEGISTSGVAVQLADDESGDLKDTRSPLIQLHLQNIQKYGCGEDL